MIKNLNDHTKIIKCIINKILVELVFGPNQEFYPASCLDAIQPAVQMPSRVVHLSSRVAQLPSSVIYLLCRVFQLTSRVVFVWP